MLERIRVIFRKTCDDVGVQTVKRVLARDHVHLFLPIPLELSLFGVIQDFKGRSSRRIQMGFPDLRNRYLARKSRAHGDYSTASGNVMDEIVL